ncbi:MAG: thiamine pyrophosphate-dependent dehydrogenase E1 component subunit alpha [Thaumarchaeota archaeon]|nr:thiamine pyrophosphate-dependent dehydrogenase E1 component subunit alpha [Nitrososphaerota archaeon]
MTKIEPSINASKSNVPSKMLQILKPDGTPCAMEPSISNEQLLEAYRNMVFTRLLDDKIVALQRQGRMGTYVSCAGQEATQIGAVLALEEKDWIFPMYRDLGMIVQKKVPLDSLMNRLFANEDDDSKGRDLPNAFGWKKYRIFSLAAPIASHVQPAVGFAMAAQYKNDDSVALATFGDGATSSSEFHVSMNFAGVYKAPAIFVCENNQYAISVPVSQQTASESIAIKARAYGFEGIRVDGNDLLAVYSSVKKATEVARRGGGPTLIECVTYRLGAHSTSDDWKKYRSVEEVEEWRSRDPISRLRVYLERKSAWSNEEDLKFRNAAETAISNAINKAESISAPAVKSMFDDVLAEISWNLRDDLKEMTES